MTSSLVSALVAAVVGAVLAVGTVVGGTSIAANNTPPPVEKPVFVYGPK
jgi:hypothetical protein